MSEVICAEQNIDEILSTIQTGRKNSPRFERACDALWKLAELADEKNRPERERKKAAEELARQNAKPGESITIDCTPDWTQVLHYFIQGIRSKKNPQELTDKLLNNLRAMATYAQASE